MADELWILKVLSGVHVGAEASLAEEEYILGKGEDCDLVLDDVSLADSHISLRLADGRLVLKLLEPDWPIYIDGEKFTGAERILEPFQVISIGALFLAVGPAHEEWPPIDLLSERKVQPKQADSPAQAEEAQEQEQPEPVEQQPETVEEGVQVAQAGPARATRYWLVGSLLILICMAVLAGWLLKTQAPGDSLAPDAAERARELVAQYGADIQVQEIAGEPSSLSISGHIDMETNRLRLLQALKNTGIPAEVNIISLDKIEHALTTVLDNTVNRNGDNRVEAVALPDAPGDFALRGYVQDRAVWQDALTTLRNNVQNYNELHDEVETLDDRMSSLRNMLMAASLDGRVEIQRSGRGLALSGRDLTEAEQEKLAGVRQRFQESFPAGPALTRAAATEPQQAAVDLAIRGITLGAKPYIILQDGRRYTEGAQLDNGYTIESITSGAIILTRGMETARIEL